MLIPLFIYGVTRLSSGEGNPFSSENKIGVVLIDGLIANADAVVERLDAYEKDESVRGVVIRVDSPGGGVVPAQEIYDKIRELKKKKSVVVSMGAVAASGGYYIACASDRIVANPGTITGSIGVIIQFSQVKKLLQKIGLESTVIKSGKYKDVGSPVREMREDERALVQGVVDDIYDQFLEAVASGRKMPKETVHALADGRIYTGRQALRMGLVDEMGNMDYAITLAARLGGIEGKPEVVYPKSKRRGLLRYLTQTVISVVRQEIMNGDTGIHYLYQR
jgi:protease-4